jgi:hypothetical protein
MFVDKTAQVPTRAGRITLVISSMPDPANMDNGLQPTGSFECEILDANNNPIRVKAGDAVPELTNTEKQNIVNLMTGVRTRANIQITT